MNELNGLFRRKLGIAENEVLTFDTLDKILAKTAAAFPFENLCVISNQSKPITKENLIQKILVQNEGGLCYQLNPLLYFFLLENGFNVVLVRGDVYNHTTKDWPRLRTHIAILLEKEGRRHLVDTGFGAKLPLKPVPMNGEISFSGHADFRVKAMESDFGDYILEMKHKHQDTDWTIAYAFNSKRPVVDISELNEVQRLIVEHKDSPFNKSPLITQLKSDGTVATLTDTSFTESRHGKSKKEQIDHVRFTELAKKHFGL